MPAGIFSAWAAMLELGEILADKRQFGLRHMPAAFVLRDDKADRIVASVSLVTARDAELLAGLLTGLAVQHQAVLVQPHRIEQPVGADVGHQELKLRLRRARPAGTGRVNGMAHGCLCGSMHATPRACQPTSR